MAEVGAAAPKDLGDLFKKGAKKKIKGTNLNAAPAAAKGVDKKAKTKDQEEEGWQEQEVVASTIKVEVAGNLNRTEDKKEEVDSGAAWGATRKAATNRDDLNEKKYPSLKGPNSTINIDDGSNAKVNIKTSKNVFEALGDEGEDSDGPSRPKEIKPAMVQKKKGEFAKTAIQREVNKYTGPGAKDKKQRKGEDEEDEDESEEEEEEDEEEREAAASAEQQRKAEATEARKKEKEAKKGKENMKPKKEEEAAVDDEDCQIAPDLAAAKAKYGNFDDTTGKYVGRKKPFADQPLPRSELEEERKVNPQAKVEQKSGGGKKKKMVMDEEDTKPNIKYLSDSE